MLDRVTRNECFLAPKLAGQSERGKLSLADKAPYRSPCVRDKKWRLAPSACRYLSSEANGNATKYKCFFSKFK